MLFEALCSDGEGRETERERETERDREGQRGDRGREERERRDTLTD